VKPMIHHPFIADADSSERHVSGMYRDAPPSHDQASKPLHPLLEKLYAAAFSSELVFYVASPLLFVLHAWREIYTLILRSLAPQPLCGAELDALFTRLGTDFPVRLVSYTRASYSIDFGHEEEGRLVVLTFRNGDVVSFDALASRALERQARLCAAADAKIEEHLICPNGIVLFLSLFPTLIESIVLAFFSKVLALLFAGTFVVTWIALFIAFSIAERQRGER
jgi:hypothetical protein